MKKLKLSNFDLTEILSRDELKKIVGGDFGSGSGTGSGSPKQEACKGKKEGDACSWMYNGSSSPGHCRSYMAQPLHCSDLS